MTDNALLDWTGGETRRIHRVGTDLCAGCRGPDGCVHGLDVITVYEKSGFASCDVICRPDEGGNSGLAHGGWICKALDEICGQRAVISHGAALTAYLNVQFRAPAGIGETLTCCARIDRAQGRKIFVSGQLVRPGTSEVLASAEGLFITVRPLGGHAENGLAAPGSIAEVE